MKLALLILAVFAVTLSAIVTIIEYFTHPIRDARRKQKAHQERMEAVDGWLRDRAWAALEREHWQRGRSEGRIKP